MTRPSDTLFAEPLTRVGDFRFDDAVVDVFPDMLERSIPGYHSIIRQTGLLAARYTQPGTCLYDLGCSLGATSLSMQAALLAQQQDKAELAPCEIHAVDNSAAMIARCRSQWHDAQIRTPGIVPIHLHEADLQTLPLQPASVVAMNFTLQFVPPNARADLMRRISQALKPGGILIISEKLGFEDPALEQLHQDMYYAFKRANGYSALEISQKRESLERVMQTDTLQTHENRLLNSGFQRCSVWFQCFNFVSIAALKD